jgi:tetratricopeptide (TPR) repeat protein
LNRSQARLKVHHFEGALNDCQDILKNDPNNIKALYRSVKALYALENYDEALVQVKNLLKIDPKNVDGQRESSAIVTRIEEKRKGLYNFNQMIEEAKKSSTPRLDNASYVGPVQLTEVSYREKIYKSFILIIDLLILTLISEVRVE